MQAHSPFAFNPGCVLLLPSIEGVILVGLGRLWAGRVYGTHAGNVFLKMDGEDHALIGSLHVNELGIGTSVFAIRGVYDGQQLNIIGELRTENEVARLMATLIPNPKGELTGERSTSGGGAGTVHLHPHDEDQTVENAQPSKPQQLHTARHTFAAVKIDRNDIIALAEEIQQDFSLAKVVVTILAGTEQSRFLSDFKSTTFPAGRAQVVKIFVQERKDDTEINRIAQLEFGQDVNFAMTQGGDEAWALGMLEKLKRQVRPFEQTYATIKKWNINFNQLLLVVTVVYLPSLSGFRDRAILMGGVLALALGVVWLHSRYLPMAAIYLGTKPQGLMSKTLPSLLSWFIAVSAGAAATVLAALLQGWLPTAH